MPVTDNRFPLLLEAALNALVAITDVGVERGDEPSPEGLAYLMDRRIETGQTLNQRLEEAHGKLQEALKLYAKELGDL